MAPIRFQNDDVLETPLGDVVLGAGGGLRLHAAIGSHVSGITGAGVGEHGDYVVVHAMMAECKSRADGYMETAVAGMVLTVYILIVPVVVMCLPFYLIGLAAKRMGMKF